MIININSNKDIDYTILNKRMEKTEKREIDLVGDSILNELINKGSLTENNILDIKRRVKARNLMANHRKTYTFAKSGTHQHIIGDVYEKGLLHQWGYTLIETNLATCFLQILEIISGLVDYNFKELRMDMSDYDDELAKFFSGEMETDEEVQQLLVDLSKRNSFFSAYINKAISLTDSKEIITVDAFKVKRTYKHLYPIEAITIPISFSLNTLMYAIVEEMRDRYRRGEKRFGCVHNYKIFYFVRDDVVDKYLNMKFTLDGVELDIKHKIVEIEKTLLSQ